MGQITSCYSTYSFWQRTFNNYLLIEVQPFVWAFQAERKARKHFISQVFLLTVQKCQYLCCHYLRKLTFSCWSTNCFLTVHGLYQSSSGADFRPPMRLGYIFFSAAGFLKSVKEPFPDLKQPVNVKTPQEHLKWQMLNSKHVMYGNVKLICS